MRSLIIGATTLLGNYMYDYLVSIGHECLGTKTSYEIECISNNSYRELNLLKSDEISELLNEFSPDYIFDFASNNSVKYSWENPENTVEVNVNGTINLLEQVRNMKKEPKILIIGSGEEYGRVGYDKFPVSESTILHPNNVYAVSKTCQTMISRIYHQAYGLKIIIARIFNYIGPGQSDKFSISNFCKQVILIEKGLQPNYIKVGNVNVERDFLDVRDVVKICWLLAYKGKYGEVYNVCSGTSISILDVIKCINKMLSANFNIMVEKDRVRIREVPCLKGDITKLKKIIDWNPEVELEKSINDMLNFWRVNI